MATWDNVARFYSLGFRVRGKNLELLGVANLNIQVLLAVEGALHFF